MQTDPGKYGVFKSPVAQARVQADGGTTLFGQAGRIDPDVSTGNRRTRGANAQSRTQPGAS